MTPGVFLINGFLLDWSEEIAHLSQLFILNEVEVSI